MRTNIAERIGIAPDAVGVKATTNEKLGPEGEEGISCQAVVLLRSYEPRFRVAGHAGLVALFRVACWLKTPLLNRCVCRCGFREAGADRCRSANLAALARATAGFLSRDLYWDAALEQGVLLIRWASREQWKAISPEEVERVQRQFDADVNTSLGRPSLSKSAFPLVAETELLPLP